MAEAVIVAALRSLIESRLSLDEIGVFEVNEAFAPVPLAWSEDIGADEKKLNPKAARARWVIRSVVRAGGS